MKKIGNTIICFLMVLVAGAIFAQDANEMMGQYKGMSEGTEKNFPKELEVLMPKGYIIKTRGFVFQETGSMFLFVALSGTRTNDVNKKSGLDSDIEIGIMAYNPQLASYMAAQMPTILQATKKEYAKNITNESGGGWELGPVAVSKINQADVYIQKGTRKHVEIDDNKYEDQVYYFAKAVMLHKNALVNIGIIYYPQKSEGLVSAINEITRIILATNFDKYMK